MTDGNTSGMASTICSCTAYRQEKASPAVSTSNWEVRVALYRARWGAANSTRTICSFLGGRAPSTSRFSLRSKCGCSLACSSSICASVNQHIRSENLRVTAARKLHGYATDNRLSSIARLLTATTSNHTPGEGGRSLTPVLTRRGDQIRPGCLSARRRTSPVPRSSAG